MTNYVQKFLHKAAACVVNYNMYRLGLSRASVIALVRSVIT